MRWLAVGIIGSCCIAAQSVTAQQWLPGTSIDLVRRAAAHRALRDADTALTSWSARAHGVVRFTTLSGEPPDQVERVLRADELRVDVYGEWPGRSKQVIVAWRDTSFLPNTLRYHRDHLGIVANDFGGTIRIGDGDEVRDVIHPLSDSGLVHYRFALGDTVFIASAAATVRVVAVSVRPADPAAPGVVGTLYLDLDRAALVRFLFTFTPASYRDATVEDITVTLENALQSGARWLPWRQTIAIRRGNPILELPWRTVIRGDWQIDEYHLGVAQPTARFAGAAIDGLRRPAAGATWDGPLIGLLQTLPASDAEIAQAQRDASKALGGRMLDGLPALRLFGTGAGDFFHIDRVQGVTPGFGARLGVGPGLVARARLGYGLSDHRLVGAVELVRPVAAGQVAFELSRSMEDVGDQPVVSSLGNSLTTLAGGRDHGDYTLVQRVGIRIGATIAGTRFALTGTREGTTSVSAAFTPLHGTSRANPALGAGVATVGRLSLARRSAADDGWTVALEGGSGDSTWARAALQSQATVHLGRDALVFRAEAGAGTRGLPGYRAFVLGGRGSLVGVADRALGGRRFARLEAAWAMPAAIPMPRLSSRLQVRLPSTLSLVAAAGVAGGPMPGLPWQASGRVEPMLGLRLDLWGPLLRLEGGLALRTGHAGFTLDLHPSWWRFF